MLRSWKTGVKRYGNARICSPLKIAPLIGQLGYGLDRNVFATERQSAIKVLQFQRLYERERDVYLRLQSQSIAEVGGFSVPELIHHDDRLWVVEMGIVSPPFVLNFAGAYLDKRPDYPDEVMEEWQADKLEQFGEERSLIVQNVMTHFARMGIYLADVKPGNISFAEAD
jgi:hypothetical protein